MSGAALLHRQAGLSAIKGLDLALLIDREDDGVSGSIDVEADDVAQFVDKLRVGICSPLSAVTGSRFPAMQVGGLHSYWEQYIEEAVEYLGKRQIRPPPSTEKSHGITPDYRCAGALVRRRRILGSQSRPLVTN